MISFDIFDSSSIFPNRIKSVFRPKFENGYVYTIYEFKSHPNERKDVRGDSFLYLNNKFYKWYLPFTTLQHLGGGERYNTHSKDTKNLILDIFQLIFNLIYIFVTSLYVKILVYQSKRKSKNRIYNESEIKDYLKTKYHFENYGDNVQFIEYKDGSIVRDFTENNLLRRVLKYDNDNIIEEIEFEYDKKNTLITKSVKNYEKGTKNISKISQHDDLIIKENLITEVKNEKIHYEIHVSYNNIRNINDNKNFYSITCKRNGDYYFIITKSINRV